MFRWSYIAFPLVIFAVSVILAALFFPKLPSEIAYHFGRDGSPDKWASRGLFTILALLPQFVLTFFAAATAGGMSMLSARLGKASRHVGTIRPERVILLMGNMLALPQAVLAYAMLDIFVFNVFQFRLMPLWVFAVIVMGAGGIVLGIFFARAVRQALRPTQ